MSVPDQTITHQIDALIGSSMSFALYRLPWDTTCHLVLQCEGEPLQLQQIESLNCKRGFVIAPFHLKMSTPIVLIDPQNVAHGWSEIGELLQSVCPKLSAQSASTDLVHSSANSNVSEDREAYERTFAHFLDSLQSGAFQKLVLSRTRTVPLRPDFSSTEIFLKACERYPRMMIYLCHTPITGTWLGSTPELLLNGGAATSWHTVALAGTMPIRNEQIPTDWSEKNQYEQSVVSRYLRKTLSLFSKNTQEEGPQPVRAGNLAHLKSTFSFSLDSTDYLGDLLTALHPTPAVCGFPKDVAYDWIMREEGIDRKYYTGFMGWLDPQGETNLYVNLRCMELKPQCATLYAGGGILPASTCDSEWQETVEKMKTMNQLL